MLKIIFRSVVAAILRIITLPIRLVMFILIACVAIYMAITGQLGLRESWDAIKKGLKMGWDEELHWIKTGEVPEREL